MTATPTRRATACGAALAASLLALVPPISAASSDYRLLYGQATSAAQGTQDLVIDVLDPAYNTGYVWGGSAMSSGHRGVNASADAADATLGFNLYAEVGELRNSISSSSTAGLTAGVITRANAWGVSIARWGDSFTMSGAYGTPILMRATIDLVAQGGLTPFSLNSQPGGGPIGNALSYYVALPVIGATTFTCHDRDGSCNQSVSFEFTLLSGTTHSLNADLTLSAYTAAVATTVPDPLPTQSAVSFSALGRVYLDVLTPDYRYDMSSGVSLTTPVPEPGAGVTLLAGLAVMAGLLRRRGRSGR